jgi:hypothetical protein
MTWSSLAVSKPKGGGMSLVRSIRELAARESNGLSVRLLWHPLEGAVTVSVEDYHEREYFVLAVAPEHALDAFYHPFVPPTLEERPK